MLSILPGKIIIVVKRGLLPVTFCYLKLFRSSVGGVVAGIVHCTFDTFIACRLANTRSESYLGLAPEDTAAMAKPFVDGQGDDVREAYEDVRSDSSETTW